MWGSAQARPNNAHQHVNHKGRLKGTVVYKRRGGGWGGGGRISVGGAMVVLVK